MAQHPDCIVIGGGLIGLLTARELARAGLRVTLLERGETGRESSWAGGGILSPLRPWQMPEAITRLALWGNQHWPELAARLHEESGTDPEYTRSGFLIIPETPTEVATARVWAEQHEVTLRHLDPASALEVEPAIDLLGDALWMPQIAQVRNPRLLRAARGAALHHGVEIRTQTAATRLTGHAGRVTAVETTQGRLQADQVVVCSGAWSSQLIDPLGTPAWIRPVRGQMLVLPAAPGCLKRIVMHHGHYAIPRRDGQIVFGSTVEEAGFVSETTAEALEQLLAAAWRTLPPLRGVQPSYHWAGLRPGSPEGIPTVARHPEYENLFVNSGHFRNGVVMGPASVHLLTTLLLGTPCELPAEPYALQGAH